MKALNSERRGGRRKHFLNRPAAEPIPARKMPTMQSSPSVRNRFFALILLFALAALSLASCSLYRNDRVFIPQEKYAEAVKVYERTSSLDLTEQILRDSHNWRRAEINEAVYRIRKQFRME